MKNSPHLKSGLRMLVLAGALSPLAAVGDTAMDYPWTYAEPSMIEYLKDIQASPSVGTMRGAQGPVRGEFDETSGWSKEGTTNRFLQSNQQAASMGADSNYQQSFRADDAELPTFSFH